MMLSKTGLWGTLKVKKGNVPSSDGELDLELVPPTMVLRQVGDVV